MNTSGSKTSRNTTPESSTSSVNTRPTSLVNVMSPKPKVDMTVIVQYRPVTQL
jgi:hypothetical protein